MLARRLQQIVRGPGAPNLVLAQRVIDKMATAANQHLEDETGEAMVGFIVAPSLPNGVPTIYVLDTISPDSSAVRQFHTFQQGDERQGDIFQWLYNNWEVQRGRQRGGINKVFQSKWNVPLKHVGDWHKQPGYMIQPSGGDLMTALDCLDDGFDFLVAPILTLDHPTTISMAHAVSNFVIVPDQDDTALRVDFWYIDRMTRFFVPIIPAIYPNDQLPELFPYPWHLEHEALAHEEFGLMQDDSLALSITHWDADGELPLEVCLLTMRVGSDKLIILVTAHNFPKKGISARVAPVVAMRDEDDMQAVFEKAWERSQPVDLPYDVSKYPTLLSYLHAVEDKLGVQRVAHGVAFKESSGSSVAEAEEPKPAKDIEEDAPETEDAS